MSVITRPSAKRKSRSVQVEATVSAEAMARAHESAKRRMTIESEQEDGQEALRFAWPQGFEFLEAKQQPDGTWKLEYFLWGQPTVYEAPVLPVLLNALGDTKPTNMSSQRMSRLRSLISGWMRCENGDLLQLFTHVRTGAQSIHDFMHW